MVVYLKHLIKDFFFTNTHVTKIKICSQNVLKICPKIDMLEKCAQDICK